MSEVHYVSDLHLGHALVAQIRGFTDADAHDDCLEERWGKVIRKDDLVYVHGDLAMSRTQYALDRIATWPGRKRLILGNHDPRHPMHRQSFRWVRQFAEVFESVDTCVRRRIDGQDVLLSHFPYAGGDGSDHTLEARYTQWRMPDEGLWLLHGHTHMADQRLHGRQIHVGLDAWDLTPVAQPQVIELMRSVTE